MKNVKTLDLPLTRHEIYIANKLMNTILYHTSSGIQWYVSDSCCNIEIVRFYYIICYCIAVKFIDDDAPTNLFTHADGYSAFVNNKSLRSNDVYEKYEMQVLKLIDYTIPYF